MNFSITKSVFPDFDIEKFKMFDKVIFLKWESVFDNESWEEHKNLILELTSPNNYKILIECINVDSFRFRGNGQISGFYIKDMSIKGYENSSKYEVGDYEEDELEFYCSDVIIKNIENDDDKLLEKGINLLREKISIVKKKNGSKINLEGKC